MGVLLIVKPMIDRLFGVSVDDVVPGMLSICHGIVTVGVMLATVELSALFSLFEHLSVTMSQVGWSVVVPRITSFVVTSSAMSAFSKCATMVLDAFSASVAWIHWLHFFHDHVRMDAMQNAPSVAGKCSKDKPKCGCHDKLKMSTNHKTKIPAVDLLMM